MIKKILFALLFGMFIAKPALAINAATYGKAYGSPNEMMTYYYQNKDIDRALEIIQQISDAEILEHYQHTFTPLVGFVVGVIAENEDAAEKIHELNVSPSMQECISVAEQLLKEYDFEDILSNPDNIDDEKDLDMLWGVFFATGNPKIPETIHAFVENNKISKAPSGQKSRQDIVVMSAIWSLESNAKQHEIVEPYAKFPVQSDAKGNQNIITFYQEVKKHQ